MTDLLPTVTPYRSPAVVTAADLRAFLRGVPPGTYRTADLHPRYKAWAEQEGKTALSAKTLGEAIHRAGIRKVATGHGHISVWDVTENWTR